MSLQSNGSTFSVIVPLGPAYEKAKSHFDLVRGPNIKPLKTVFRENHLTAGNDIASKKKAFLELMAEFSNSAEFEALTFDLQNNFCLNVRHSINLSMPVS